MKIKSILVAALVVILTTGMSFAQNKAASTGSTTAKSKTLVVYFSHTGEQYSVGNVTEGNTAVIAKMIAKATGADTFEIVPEKDYPKLYKTCTDVAKAEQRENARPAYKGDIDTSAYDTVFIGYPIWWGDLPMVVYSFLDKHDLNGKTIIPFCTHEGSGTAGTDSAFKKKYKGAKVAEMLAVRGSVAQNKRNEAQKSVDAWLKKIGF